MRNDDVKPNFCLVIFDEMRFYNIAPDDAKWIKAIWQSYVYDQNEYTYCCELTPSHYLEPVYTSIELVDDAPDELRDELDGKYCGEPTEPSYRHVAGLKAYVEKHPHRHHVHGEADSLDEAREYYQGNHVL